MVPMFRSCGDAASRHASRSASGICGATSSSASVVPAPMRTGLCGSEPLRRFRAARPPRRGRARRPARVRRATAVRAPCRRPDARPAVASESRDGLVDGARPVQLQRSRSSFARLAQRAQDLLARQRQRLDLGSGRVADRVRDRGRRRDDRRLAEALRAEVRQVLVRDVDELAHDLGHVGDRRQLVGVERPRQDGAVARVVEPHLRERVAERLHDPALDLAPRPERVDDPADVVDRDDLLDARPRRSRRRPRPRRPGRRT